ncbi:hypothetical protein [Nocardia sp. NPDC049149]|uniref:hypothetical protein n=1 Tax=Nocardia sp. NPDC049149 TaxID=3364315 RepID=UPI0037210100
MAETAWSTALLHHQVLSATFKLAVLGRAIDAKLNPMPYVPAPSPVRAIPRPLDPQVQKGVLRRIETWLCHERGESQYARLLYLLLLGTGLRPGEGLATRWCDLTREVINGVEKTVLYVGATVAYRGGTTVCKEGRKAGNPYRVVLPNWLGDELWAEKARVNPASDELPIFRGPRSDSWVSTAVARVTVQAMRAGSDYSEFRWSDLRDTVATHIATETEDDARASAQLGHANGAKSMAQQHYIHQGIRRMVAVDNSNVLELLNPFKTGTKLESAA